MFYGAFGGVNPGHSGYFKLDDVKLSVADPAGMLITVR